MKLNRILLVPLLALALFASGCAGNPLGRIGDAIHAATSVVTDPVNIYRVKLTYGAALDVANAWRETCWGKPYAELVAAPVTKALCQNRRATLRALQRADLSAQAAIASAEQFAQASPQNAAAAITAAWNAVIAFQSAIPKS